MLLRPLLSAACMAAGLLLHAQQNRIVVEHGNNLQVFRDIGTAVAAAPAGASLYLSGGTFVLPPGFALDKTLHFFGAGIHPDSSGTTGPTMITDPLSSQYFLLVSGSSGSTFTGIWFNMYGANTAVQFGTSVENQTVQNIVFTRCRFQQAVVLGAWEPAPGSAVFSECIFHHYVAGNGSSGHFVRCIFDWEPSTAAGTINVFRPSGLLMEHCVVLGGLVGNTQGATIRNCVFTRQHGAPFWQGSNSTISNCLIGYTDLTSNSGATVVGTNNTMNVPFDAFFVDLMDEDYAFTNDLHLQAGSAGIGAATDGTDIGIYGSTSPYKDGAAPHAPHYLRIAMAPGTDADGQLHVQVKAAAQTH